MRTRLLAVVAGVGLLLAAAPAWAHHAFAAEFDQNKPIKVQGSVVRWELTNPHSWLWVEVKGKDGKAASWGFEAEGPSTLLRAGIKPSDFKVGTKLTITGNPMRNGEKAAIWLNAVRTADGKKFDPRAGFAVK